MFWTGIIIGGIIGLMFGVVITCVVAVNKR